MNQLFSGYILKKYFTNYYQCPECKFLCTDYPIWLDQAYKNPINMTDTGIIKRNIMVSVIVSCIIYILFSKRASHLDYGGGYGIFTRIMRDVGFDFYWYDPHTSNLFARGFEYSDDHTIDVITSFESFEHFIEPLEDITKMVSISNNIIFTTKLLPHPVPLLNEWWYYGLEHGQHVSFYSHEALELIAKQFQLNYYSVKNVHILTKKNFNKFYLSLISLFYWMIYPIILITMKSKTFDDMVYNKRMEEFE